MRQILKQAREAYNDGEGLTQKETATAIGVSERFYRHIENGTREGKGRIWDALEALFGISQRQLRDDNTHPDYSNNDQSGEEKVKELEAAHRQFDFDSGMILDIAKDGRLDCPERRKVAEALYSRLGDVLGKTA